MTLLESTTDGQGFLITQPLLLHAVKRVVKYSSLLPVPLTAQHQNCAYIGAMAIVTMLQRVEKPNLPTRDILLQARKVVRRSCGTHRPQKLPQLNPPGPTTAD